MPGSPGEAVTTTCLIVGDRVMKRGPGGARYGVGKVTHFTRPMSLYRVEWKSSQESGVMVGWYYPGELKKVTGEVLDELLPVKKEGHYRQTVPFPKKEEGK